MPYTLFVVVLCSYSVAVKDEQVKVNINMIPNSTMPCISSMSMPEELKSTKTTRKTQTRTKMMTRRTGQEIVSETVALVVTRTKDWTVCRMNATTTKVITNQEITLKKSPRRAISMSSR